MTGLARIQLGLLENLLDGCTFVCAEIMFFFLLKNAKYSTTEHDRLLARVLLLGSIGDVSPLHLTSIPYFD